MVLELFLTEYFYGKKIKELYEKSNAVIDYIIMVFIYMPKNSYVHIFLHIFQALFLRPLPFSRHMKFSSAGT